MKIFIKKQSLIKHPFNIPLLNMFTDHKQNSTFQALSQQNYINILKNYNSYPRKPPIELVQYQNKFMTKQLSSNELQDQISFILKIKQYKMINLESTSKLINNLQRYITNNKINIPNLELAYGLLLLGYQQYFKSLQNNIKPHQLSSLQLVLYLYCSLLLHKKIKEPSTQEFLNKIKNEQIHKYTIQKSQIIKYIQLKPLNPRNLHTQKSLQRNNGRSSSPLQLDVEAILKLLKIQYQKQIQIKFNQENKINVDFLINVNSSFQVLQILGSHHYLHNQCLKQKQIIRGCLINKIFCLKYLHIRQYNKTKGLRNKISLVKDLIQREQTNWKSNQQGFNSNWVLQ